MAPGQVTTLSRVLSTVPETADVGLKVEGAIPQYVQGSLMRNGPGAFELKHRDGAVTPIRHWFDGVSLLHRFAVNGAEGSVRYRSRFTASSILETAASVNKRDYSASIGVGVDPCKGIFGRLMSMFLPTTAHPDGKQMSNIGVTVEMVPGLGLLSRSDTVTAFPFSPDELDQGDFFSWSSLKLTGGEEAGLRGQMSAAHGELDEEANEYFNFVFDMQTSSSNVEYKVFRVGSDGCADVLAKIPAPPTYSHSIGLTKKYVVMVMYPMVVNAVRLMFTKSLIGGMRFDDARETRFFVISRETGGVVAEFTGDPCWAFHVVNAYDVEEEDSIAIDLCRYDNGKIVWDLYADNIRDANPELFSNVTICRFALSGITSDAVTKRATFTELSKTPMELVRINPAVHLKPYRYAYAPSCATDTNGAPLSVFSKIAKVDLEEDKTTLWGEGDMHCSEPVFVADPEGVAEDDGCLLSVCYDLEMDKSFLAVVDARTMTEVARAYTPTVVPAGFHGAFV